MVKPIIPQPVQYMQEGNKNSRGGLWPPLHKIFQWTFPLPRRLRILSYFDIMAVLPDITQSVATENRGVNKYPEFLLIYSSGMPLCRYIWVCAGDRHSARNHIPDTGLRPISHSAGENAYKFDRCVCLPLLPPPNRVLHSHY